jgi:hypothetical protein
VFVCYTGVDRTSGYLREAGIRLVLDTKELILTNPITTFDILLTAYHYVSQ